MRNSWIFIGQLLTCNWARSVHRAEAFRWPGGWKKNCQHFCMPKKRAASYAQCSVGQRCHLKRFVSKGSPAAHKVLPKKVSLLQKVSIRLRAGDRLRETPHCAKNSPPPVWPWFLSLRIAAGTPNSILKNGNLYLQFRQIVKPEEMEDIKVSKKF